MVRLTAFLLTSSFFLPISSFSQEPLTETEKRSILGYLLELKVQRERVVILQEAIDRDKAQDQREAEINQKLLDNEKRARELAEAERDLFKAQAAEYKNAFEAVSKHKRCIRKWFSLGLLRCN